MKLGIIRLYIGESGQVGYYNIQEVGLAKALKKKGVNTDIFFLSKKEDIEVNNICDGIRIIYIPARSFGNHGIVNPNFILDYNLDIIHLLSDNQLMVPEFVRFCKKRDIPIYNYVGTIYSDSQNKVKRIILNIFSMRNIRCFRNSKVIAKTPHVKGQLEEKGVVGVDVIPVGLDLDIIPKIEESKESLRKKLDLPINKNILIFVGRLEEYKRPLESVKLMYNLKNMSKDYYLIIIGKGTMKKNLLSMISKFHLTRDVMFIERVENKKIHEYYRASDYFLNFNKDEIFGMSILEAMYQKCNVIATSAPGPDYIIKDNVNGMIIKNGNIDDFANSIKNNNRHKEIGVNANKIIINKFNWNNIANKYLNLYKVLNSKCFI